MFHCFYTNLLDVVLVNAIYAKRVFGLKWFKLDLYCCVYFCPFFHRSSVPGHWFGLDESYWIFVIRRAYVIFLQELQRKSDALTQLVCHNEFETRHVSTFWPGFNLKPINRPFHRSDPIIQLSILNLCKACIQLETFSCKSREWGANSMYEHVWMSEWSNILLTLCLATLARFC